MVELEGLEPAKSNTSFYLWRTMSYSEIEDHLDNLISRYNGGMTAFGTGDPLTQEMLYDASDDATDGIWWFRLNMKKWGSRNLAKYLMGFGGVDIYGFNELTGNTQFDKLVKNANKEIDKNIMTEARSMSNGEEKTIFLKNTRASSGQGSLPTADYNLALGATNIVANGFL